MIFSKRIYATAFFFIFCTLISKAQDKPIGYWESHLPYNSALGMATDGQTLYVICNQAFFTFNPFNNTAPVGYSKEKGMSDIGMQCIAYDNLTSTAILVYADGNIDLFKEKQNTFYNIPDLKIKSVSGTKAVYQVYAENGMAYLSTSLGILVIDLANFNIKETYLFINQNIHNEVIPVYAFTSLGDSFYAATGNGIYRANKNNPELQNFQVWQNIDSTHIVKNVANFNNSLFFSTNRSVYKLINDTLHTVFTTGINIKHIDAGDSNLFISEVVDTTGVGDVKLMDINNNITDSFRPPSKPLQVLQLSDKSIWVADSSGGLQRRAGNTTNTYIPVGPIDPNCFDIYANNKNVWIAYGGFYQGLTAFSDNNGITNFSNGNWATYKQYVFNPLDSMQDFCVITKDESNGAIYAGSYTGGLFILYPNKSYQILKQSSIFESSEIYTCCGDRQIVGIGIDQSDNVWVSTLGSRHQLYVKDATDSVWYKFLVPNAPNGGPIVIDDNGQVWFACLGNNGGVAVYNAKGTLRDLTDDKSYHLTTGIGTGNLPSNNIFCIAKDHDNNIWIGTDNGIGIVSNCSAPFTPSTICDAQLPIVQYDKYAGYLFAGTSVRSIAVDGANRKWVGTDAGVWLLSPNAAQIIYRFTTDNSPLPSNIIQKISIDKATGDVYIGTEQGLIVYHSTATEGGTTNSNVLVYPNPVPPGYNGTIAIKGLVANADVRITDIDGQLVYRTTALGGQAVWNGIDYKGHRPQTGVYLVFVSSSDGTQTYCDL
jgi:ligand-binding sensor domain-containing protein